MRRYTRINRKPIAQYNPTPEGMVRVTMPNRGLRRHTINNEAHIVTETASGMLVVKGNDANVTIDGVDVFKSPVTVNGIAITTNIEDIETIKQLIEG